jgi:ligand-binding sensor domain-containing protein/signal transduction histidine kinase
MVFQALAAADPSGPIDTGLQVKVEPRAIRLPIADATENRFVRLSASDGLLQTKADHIVQDDQGFMWFGTRYGLYRYDGYAFKVFARDAGNPKSLDGVVVKSLFKDRDGVLWVGCDRSLNKLDRTTETFTPYPIRAADHITQDAAGMLWITSPGAGLYGLDPASGRMYHYSHDPTDPSSLSNTSLSYCGEDREGNFWVASDGHLDEFDRRAGKVTKRILLPQAPGGFKFYEDRFGVFWIFHGPPNTLAALDRKSNTLTYYAFPKREPTMMKVTAMLEDQKGVLWIATHGLGLLKLDREHGRFIRYSNVPEDPESIPQDKLDALFADREGNIWVAPGRLGLALFPTKPPPFKKLPKVPGTTIEPFVSALYEDEQGILWIGTPEALNRLDRKTGQITAYRVGGPEVGTDVMSIREDRSGNLWVGTYGHGLHRFDRKTGKFKTYRHNPADPYSLSSDFVLRLFIDHNGALWAGTADALNRLDAVTGRFTTYKLPKTFFYIELVEDREGKIWLGTESSGLRHFDPATSHFESYEYDRNLPGTLSDNRVNSVHIDRSGTAWVGTQHGLDKLDAATGRFTSFTQRDGLAGNAVGCILEDKNANLWMSTNNGVARFNSRSETFTNFSVADGLPGSNLTGWGACFQNRSGEMFFGGFNGGTSFFADEVVDSPYAPPIVLTEFRLSGSPVEVGDHSPLRRSISYTTDLTLEHQQNVFSFTFATLSYSSPATNRHRYRLEGLEGDWNEVRGDRRQATYTTLPAGRYTFRAQGATSGGAWSEPGVVLQIQILPPWWSTRPFQAVVGILLFLIAWAAYGQRLRRVAQRFETRLAERTRIARELHDTLLQSFHGLMFRMQAARNLLPLRPEEAGVALDGAITRAEQAIAEGRNAIQNLRSEPAGASDITQLLKTMAQDLATPQPGRTDPAMFRLTVEGERQALSPLLQDEVYRIAREVLTNAFQHAHASQIEAEIRYEARAFRLRIRDDGTGIDPRVLKQGKRAGHWGLPGTRERAEQIGARLDFWSETGVGTEVQLTIPASVAYTKPDSAGEFRLVPKKRGTHEH